MSDSDQPAPPPLPRGYTALDDPRFDHLCIWPVNRLAVFRKATYKDSMGKWRHSLVCEMTILVHREALGPVAVAQGELYKLEQQLAATERQPAANPVAPAPAVS